MFVNQISTAVIPYTPPKTPMEFVRSEVERGLMNGTIKPEQVTTKPSIPSAIPELIEFRLWDIEKTFERHYDIQEGFLASRSIDRQMCDHNPRVADIITTSLSSSSVDRAPSHSSSIKKLNGDEITEVLFAEAAFTIATDIKPIVATYGASPCVALGGYDATNKIAFVVHFSNAGEVKQSGGLIFYNIAKLVKKKIEQPIKLYLRGGIKGESEEIVEAIKVWMTHREDLPMKIDSEDILDNGTYFRGKSLSIDSRTGVVAEYDPKDNPKHRVMSEQDVTSAMMTVFDPSIKIVYKPI